MQLKCPGCARTLKIPDTAAGKVVKCPCGKQLRAPGAASSQTPKADAANVPSPASSTRPAVQQTSSFGVDENMFDELSESDLQPVRVVAAPSIAAAGNPYASPSETAEPEAKPKSGSDEKVKLPVAAQVMCGWPFLLVIFGGAIGGGVGGAAYAVNVAIYKSSLAVPVKVILNILTGLCAFGLWLAAVAVLAAIRGE